jgi:uncharacterized protein YbjT (DUF2867 family)
MGITGNVGGALASTLLQRGKKVRGIVRDEAKAQVWKDRGAEVVTADYDDRLTAAFTDVEGVFCMIPPDVLPDPGFPDSVARIAAIKKAVLAAQPPQAAFLSSIGGEKTSGLGIVTTAHLLEEALGSTGVPSAFLRGGCQSHGHACETILDRGTNRAGTQRRIPTTLEDFTGVRTALHSRHKTECSHGNSTALCVYAA